MVVTNESWERFNFIKMSSDATRVAAVHYSICGPIQTLKEGRKGLPKV